MISFRRTALIFLAWAALSHCSNVRLQSSTQIANQSIGFNPKVYTLDSGLRLVIVEDFSLPVVSFQTWVQAGSRDEALGFTGIAHLFEHLMFKNSEKFQARAFLDELEAKGALVNAFTARDHTVFYETFVPELLDKVIELESDRFSDFRISAESLEIEKQVVLEERRLRLESSPEAKVEAALWQLVYPYHVYRVPVIGKQEDLFHIDLGTLRDFYNRNYHPSRRIIVVVGPVNAAQTKAKIERAYHFPKLPVTPRKTIYPDPPQVKERTLEIVDKAFVHPRLIYAFPITSVYDADSYVLDVASQMMFGGRSTKGYQSLVDEKRIFTSISSSSFTPECPGIFQIEGTLSPQTNRTEAEAALREFLFHFVERATSEDLETAKAQLSMRIVEEWQTAGGLASSIGLSMSVFNDPMRFQEDLKLYDKVTLPDIRRVIDRYLNDQNRNIVWSAAK